jgi:hypothetical protein
MRWPPAEEYDEIPHCPHCERPQVDASSQYASVACQCPFCELCGAVGEPTTVDNDTEMCAACALGD